jgi:hypothetical protein
MRPLKSRTRCTGRKKRDSRGIIQKVESGFPMQQTWSSCLEIELKLEK